MIIDCIGCLHGARPQLEGGDLLIVTGDLTALDSENEMALFDYWLHEQKYAAKIVIGGNHDNVLAEKRLKLQFGTYLLDSGCSFNGFKMWGSPWSSQFPGINPKCCAFTRPFMASLKDRWDLIPDDTDILITHTPPFGFFDMISTEYDASVGDMELRNQVMGRIKPKLHAFSHIHEWGGTTVDTNVTKFVNCSIMNEVYQPVNKPVRIVL